MRRTCQRASQMTLPVFFFAAVLPLFAGEPRASTEEQASQGSSDEWHLTLIENKPAGYLHVSVRPREGGGYITSMFQKLVLRRGPVSVETEMSSDSEEDGAGKFVAFRSSQKLSKQVMESSGVVRGAELVITDSSPGQRARESRIPVVPEAVGLQRSEELMRRNLLKPGDQLEVVVFLPEVRGYARQKAVLGDMEETECLGQRSKLRKVVTTVDVLPGIVTDTWVDGESRLVKSSMTLFGMRLVTCRATLEAVLAQDFSSPPEIFFASAVPVDGKVSRDAEGATYLLRAKGDAFPVKADAYLFRAPGQKLVREEGASGRVLRVTRIRPDGGATRPIPEAPETAEYLRANAYIQSDDAKIAKLAREAAGEEKDAWKAAKAVERWVFENVRKKNMNTAFATALEVAETREGDCTEHGVLLAALLRASGIPSRVVAGLVYHQGAFVGHMWTEVRIGGWVPLDATLGEGTVGPDHIALASSSLDSSSISAFFLEIVPVLGNLRIQVLKPTE